MQCRTVFCALQQKHQCILSLEGQTSQGGQPYTVSMLQGRSRLDSSGSAAGSETESGVLEPPSTPSAASVASIQAASKLYSTSLADRFNLKGELCTPPVLC